MALRNDVKVMLEKDWELKVPTNAQIRMQAQKFWKTSIGIKSKWNIISQKHLSKKENFLSKAIKNIFEKVKALYAPFF